LKQKLLLTGNNATFIRHLYKLQQEIKDNEDAVGIILREIINPVTSSPIPP
jgi:hypothetical protein